MKPSYRNKTPGPHPANSMLGLVSLGIAIAALVIAIVALVRTSSPPPPPLSRAQTLTQEPVESATESIAESVKQSPSLSRAAEPYVAPAGRSPIPQPGETISKPLPASRLAVPAEGVPAAQGEVVPWEHAASHLGHDITVEGTIVDTHLIESGAICFLNFHKDFRDKFYIAMFRSAFADLPQPPEEYYLGKTIRVTGLVKTHKGRPQIEVHRPDQIEIVDGS